MTWIDRLLAAHVGSRRPAVHDHTGAVTGEQLVEKVSAATDFLVGLEGRPGIPVPALLTTNADAIALLIGGAGCDRPLAPVGPRATPDEIRAVISDVCYSVLLAESAFIDIANQAAEGTGVRVVQVPDFTPSTGAALAGVHRAALYLHTAGTTGTPKRVAITDPVLLRRSQLLTELLGFGPDTVFATGSPIHHIGGVGNLLAVLTAGGAVTAPARFTLDWWRSLADLSPTHALLVPSMIEMLINAGLLDHVRVDTLIYGAAPMRPSTLQRVMAILPGIDLVNLFGQTEGSPITCLSAEDHRRALTSPDLLESVGRPVAGLRLRIAAAPGERVGEVLASADHLAGAVDDDGWLRTGDLGELDDEGYLRLRGRLNDMIVRGGENVYPDEIENVISAHPCVESVGVVGVPDDRLGETVAAFVVPVADRPDGLDVETLRAWTRTHLAGYKVPAIWHFVDKLPLNAAGKVLRSRLRTMHAQSVDGAVTEGEVRK